MSELRTNRIIPRDGLPAGSNGGIIQVVQSVVTSASTGSGGTFATVMSGSITPTSASNKILVMVDVTVGSSNGYGTTLKLYRSGTQIYFGDAAGSRPRVSKAITNYPGAATTYMSNPVHITFLDSPGVSGSSITYDVKIASYSTVSWSFNRSYADQEDTTNGEYDGRTASSITLMEVT
jgi:hypothetical protein